jgi:hypothetical protein
MLLLTDVPISSPLAPSTPSNLSSDVSSKKYSNMGIEYEVNGDVTYSVIKIKHKMTEEDKDESLHIFEYIHQVYDDAVCDQLH